MSNCKKFMTRQGLYGKERQRVFTFDHYYWSHDGFCMTNDAYFAVEKNFHKKWICLDQIATISPADVHYEETLSTLRFADRMKSIKTAPIVNESATEQMIKTVRSENELLLGTLERGALEGAADEEELKALRRQLAENQREMEKLERSWQQREETFKKQMSLGELEQSLNAYRDETPHLRNGIVMASRGPKNGIKQLKGLSILHKHALIRNKDNKKVTLMPLNGAEIFVNGKRIGLGRELRPNDRYEMAQKEIARQNLAAMNVREIKSREDLILLVTLLPYVYRSNSMAAELNQLFRFEIVLVTPEMSSGDGTSAGLTEIDSDYSKHLLSTLFLESYQKHLEDNYSNNQLQ